MQKEVGNMDGGLACDGEKGWLEIKDFDACLKDPSECHHGFAVSFKLKLNQVSVLHKTVNLHVNLRQLAYVIK